MSTPSLRTHFRDDGCRIGTLQHVVFSLWTETPTVERVEALDRALHRLFPYGDPLGGLHVIRIESLRAGALDDALRGALGRMYATTRGHAGSVAIVLETQGFAAAALRSLISNVLLVTRGSLAQRVFPDVATAAAWLAPLVAHGETGPSLEAIRDAVRELEAG